MAKEDLILSKAYNDIRAKVVSILGAGSGDKGYGQTLQSSTVGVETITESQWDQLRQDIVKTHRHQNGASPTITDVTTADNIAWAHAVQYDTLADGLITSKDTIYTGSTTGAYTQQAQTANLQTKTVAGWNSTKRYAQLDTYIRWGSADAARYFFNSGGRISLSTSLATSGTVNTKTVGWRDVVCPGMSLTYTPTNYRSQLGDLPLATYPFISQQTYDTTSPYKENYGYLAMQLRDAKTLRILIQFVDDDAGDQVTPPAGKTAGPAVDETIQGTFSAFISYRKSINEVTADTPSIDDVAFTVNA